ncbi:ABC transporter ATP-binding protein [Vulcanisaeta souniana]|uniref:ATP-binding cassette domain-containing protein n=1 Tax=Vulcanisaeta souniana TaxID=164452 RepID=UPI000A9D9A68|nr:ABC transporter ATP-binding protein [Vulcanisaeta souniana]
MKLSVNDLVVGYGGKVVINGLTVEFDEGRTVILGPNGSGKTTLLRAIAGGVIKPLRGGIIVLDGRPLRGGGDVGYVSHAGGLDPNMTVHENLEFYAEVKNASNLDEVVDRLGIRNLMNTKVGFLSNGQRRMVEIAIAMLGSPKVYALDESTDGLDVNFASRVKDIVRSLHGIVIYTTHMLSEALELADYLVIIRKGRIAFHGDMTKLGGAMRIVAKRGGVRPGLLRLI